MMTVHPRRSGGDFSLGWPYRFSETEPGAFEGRVQSWSEALAIANANEAKLWPSHPDVQREIPFSVSALKAG